MTQEIPLRDGASVSEANTSRTAPTHESHAQHTPGPWFALGHSVHPDRTNLVALVQIATAKVRHVGSLRISAQEAATNARLIAAAPDLLAALKAIHEHCPADCDINPQWQAAWNLMLAAIAKVEGR